MASNDLDDGANPRDPGPGPCSIILPAHEPQEAIDELEYVTGTLGYKAIMLRGNQERPIQALRPDP